MNTFTRFTVGNCFAVSSICDSMRGMSQIPATNTSPARRIVAVLFRIETETTRQISALPKILKWRIFRRMLWSCQQLVNAAVNGAVVG